MGTIKGKNSQHASKYDFYINYTVTSDPNNLRYKVTASAMLDIVRWKFDSRLPETVKVSIDGSTSSKQYPNGMKNWGNNSSRVSKTMHTYTKYIAYTASDQVIKLSAKTTDIDSGGYGPGVCSASGTIKLAAKFNTAGKLNAGAATESSLQVTLSGLPPKVGFERKVDWYYKLGTSSSYIKFKETTIASTSKSTSFSETKTGLLSSRPYNFKAEIKTDKKAITSKTATATTAATTLKTVLSMGNTYGNLTAIKGNIGFLRVISWYYRKSGEKEYVLSDTTKIAENETATNYTKTFSGLLSNVKYEFKIVVKTGNTLLKQVEVTGVTVKDETLVPLPVLYNVLQKPAKKNVYLYWDSPAHVTGTVYKVQYQQKGSSSWNNAEILEDFEGGSIIRIPGKSAEYAFRIAAVNSIAAGVERYSEVISAYIYDDFEWDSEKASGLPFLLTATEWNRLIDWIDAMLTKYEINTDLYQLEHVQSGDAVMAASYNTAAEAIQQISGAVIPDVSVGDVRWKRLETFSQPKNITATNVASRKKAKITSMASGAPKMSPTKWE